MITKQFILENLVKPNGKLNTGRLNKRYLIKLGIYNELLSYYIDSDSIRETIYRILNDLNDKPKCIICGKPVKFNGGGFPKHCSSKCVNADPNVLAKNKDGVSKALKNAYQLRGDEIKNKRKETLKDKYGVDTVTPFGISEIQNKVKETIKSKYGVENILQISKYRHNEIKGKRKSILLQKTKYLTSIF